MRFVPAALLLAACHSTEPIPEDLVEPTVGLFADFHEPEATKWAQAVSDFMRLREPDATLPDRTYQPDALTPDRVTVSDGTPVVVTPVNVGVISFSEHDIDDHRRLDALPERNCAEAPWTDSWTRTWDDGQGCWPIGSCRDAASGTRLVETLDGLTTTSDQREEFVELELVDGRMVYAARRWQTGPAKADSPDHTMAHDHGLRVWIEEPDDTRRSWVLDVRWTDRKREGVSDEAMARRTEEALDEGARRAQAVMGQLQPSCP